MRKSVLFLASIFLLQNSFAQVETHTPTKTQEEYNLDKDEDWKNAVQNIEQLKSGTLLVALDFKTKKIAYYRKFENHKAADKLVARQAELNKHIIHSIDSLYKFSAYSYFDIDDLDKIKSKNFTDVTFYNSSMEKDPSVKFSGGFFLVGYFGTVAEDYSDGGQYGTKNAVNAFVLRDAELKQLRRPFPYYSTYMPNTPAKKRYIVPIRRLQENLMQFDSKGEVRYEKRETRRSKKREIRAKKNQAKNQ